MKFVNNNLFKLNSLHLQVGLVLAVGRCRSSPRPSSSPFHAVNRHVSSPFSADWFLRSEFFSHRLQHCYTKLHLAIVSRWWIFQLFSYFFLLPQSFLLPPWSIIHQGWKIWKFNGKKGETIFSIFPSDIILAPFSIFPTALRALLVTSLFIPYRWCSRRNSRSVSSSSDEWRRHSQRLECQFSASLQLLSFHALSPQRRRQLRDDRKELTNWNENSQFSLFICRHRYRSRCCNGAWISRRNGRLLLQEATTICRDDCDGRRRCRHCTLFRHT